jgi:hypothetical protein
VSQIVALLDDIDVEIRGASLRIASAVLGSVANITATAAGAAAPAWSDSDARTSEVALRSLLGKLRDAAASTEFGVRYAAQHRTCEDLCRCLAPSTTPL